MHHSQRCDHDGLDFTCPQCGGHDLIVVHEYVHTTPIEQTLPSDCPHANDGIAATISGQRWARLQEWGPLDEDHRWEYEESEELDSGSEDEEEEVACHECFNEATEQDWDYEEDVEEAETSDEEFFVRCAGCDREIEFGWSHPERDGRIWPAASKDFNPWKCWPEPRYRETWKEKGWLRPVWGRQERPSVASRCEESAGLISGCE